MSVLNYEQKYENFGTSKIMLKEWLEDQSYMEEKKKEDLNSIVKHYSNIKINQN